MHWETRLNEMEVRRNDDGVKSQKAHKEKAVCGDIELLLLVWRYEKNGS